MQTRSSGDSEALPDASASQPASAALDPTDQCSYVLGANGQMRLWPRGVPYMTNRVRHQRIYRTIIWLPEDLLLGPTDEIPVRRFPFDCVILMHDHTTWPIVYKGREFVGIAPRRPIRLPHPCWLVINPIWTECSCVYECDRCVYDGESVCAGCPPPQIHSEIESQDSAAGSSPASAATSAPLCNCDAGCCFVPDASASQPASAAVSNSAAAAAAARQDNARTIIWLPPDLLEVPSDERPFQRLPDDCRIRMDDTSTWPIVYKGRPYTCIAARCPVFLPCPSALVINPIWRQCSCILDCCRCVYDGASLCNACLAPQCECEPGCCGVSDGSSERSSDSYSTTTGGDSSPTVGQ